MVKSLIVLWALLCGLAQAEQPTRGSSKTEPQTDVKVSESRHNGKYTRTTETFRNHLLIAKKQEVSLKDNGQIDYLFVKLFRDGQMIFASTFYKSANRTIRSYYHAGNMVVEEGDEDGDGFFETIILFGTNGGPVEAFHKSKDGSVTSFGPDELTKLKESFRKIQNGIGQ